jgi:hypothetical protein
VRGQNEQQHLYFQEPAPARLQFWQSPTYTVERSWRTRLWCAEFSWRWDGERTGRYAVVDLLPACWSRPARVAPGGRSLWNTVQAKMGGQLPLSCRISR